MGGTRYAWLALLTAAIGVGCKGGGTGEEARDGDGSTPSGTGEERSLIMFRATLGRSIFARDLQSGEESRLDTDPGVRFIYAADCRPDGRGLAYVAAGAAGGQRLIVAREGEADIQI